MLEITLIFWTVALEQTMKTHFSDLRRNKFIY